MITKIQCKMKRLNRCCSIIFGNIQDSTTDTTKIPKKMKWIENIPPYKCGNIKDSGHYKDPKEEEIGKLLFLHTFIWGILKVEKT